MKCLLIFLTIFTLVYCLDETEKQIDDSEGKDEDQVTSPPFYSTRISHVNPGSTEFKEMLYLSMYIGKNKTNPSLRLEHHQTDKHVFEKNQDMIKKVLPLQSTSMNTKDPLKTTTEPKFNHTKEIIDSEVPPSQELIDLFTEDDGNRSLDKDVVST